jgi:hypothetical protein
MHRFYKIACQVQKTLMKRFVSLLATVLALMAVSCTKDMGESRLDMGTGISAIGSNPGNNGGPGAAAGVITAGEWNDLKNWDFWKNLMANDTFNTTRQAWGIYPDRRTSIIIKDFNGNTIPDVKLTLQYGSSLCQAHTDNKGRAELFPGLFIASSTITSYTLKAEYKGQQFDLGNLTWSAEPVEKQLPVNKISPVTMDIMFVVDATGSMGDELEYLKTELKDVITRSGSSLPGMQIRMGSVFYRDNADEYVTRLFPFTNDVNQLNNFINTQSAGGGGDWPEAVDKALEQAVSNAQWSPDAMSRILFLVLDAPPHETEAELARVRNAVKTAQEKGIRIIPIAASGIDTKTEFLLRFFSISTNGTYVFITDHSGIGDPHHQSTVGPYDVEYLNNLMVRLITAYGKE